MSVPPPAEAIRRLRLLLDAWAVVAASLLVVAIVVGVLPRIPW